MSAEMAPDAPMAGSVLNGFESMWAAFAAAPPVRKNSVVKPAAPPVLHIAAGKPEEDEIAQKVKYAGMQEDAGDPGPGLRVTGNEAKPV